MAAAKLHLSLNVSDIARSTQWYRTFFDVAPHKERPGYANFDLDSPRVKLALNEHAGPLTGGTLNHMGVVVESTDEVLAAKERLEAAGLATFTEENVSCCHAKQDKVWVRDPDGNQWEVYVILDEMAGEHAQSEACCPPETAGCCAPGGVACCS